MLGRLLVILILTCAAVYPLEASVWDNEYEWSENWEARYQEWVENQWDTDVFTNGPYEGIRTDCADTVYGMRMIFSYENKLPFAMLEPTGRKRHITNAMTRFDNYPRGPERVKAFLEYVSEVYASTRSLPDDTFPVALNRQWVVPGGLILEREKAHSFTIKSITEVGAPVLYYSTRKNKGPLKVRLSYPSINWLFPKGVRPPSGIRYFRQPQYIGLESWEVPGYSAEQYQVPQNLWRSEVQRRLSVRREDPSEKVERLLLDLCAGLKLREQVVAAGWAFAQQVGRCMNRGEYDDHSTPSRDGQLKESYKEFEQFYAMVNDSNWPLDLDVKMRADDVYAENDSSWCKVATGMGSQIGLGTFKQRLFAGLVSSNPHDPPKLRWGEAERPGQHSKLARQCPIY